jgi:hypothetical protein
MMSMREVSSANKWMSLSMFVVISLMKIKKSSGPRMDPWGTPAVVFFHVDDWPFITTLIFLFDR